MILTISLLTLLQVTLRFFLPRSNILLTFGRSLEIVIQRCSATRFNFYKCFQIFAVLMNGWLQLVTRFHLLGNSTTSGLTFFIRFEQLELVEHRLLVALVGPNRSLDGIYPTEI